MILDYILDLFGSAQFVPHAVCLLWRPDLLIMHGLSDLLIAGAYLTIPVIIMKAVRARPDLIDPKVARLFAAFITACALSHVAGLLTLWYPAYGLQGAVKVATAAVSIYTAVQLARLLPQFLTLPSHQEMASKQAEIVVEQHRAQEANEARDKLSEFASIAAHDLKAPMRGIANHASFLLEDHGATLEPDARRRLDRMRELCNQLDTLIATLLKYSRLGRSEASEEIDPAELVENIASSLSETLAENNGEVVIETPLPKIRSNPADVATVFQNLIVNGLTYNGAERKRVAVGFQDEVVVNGRRLLDAYYVRDNGIGIDAEFHDDVFRMFKRLHQPGEYGGGTGAGLAFARKVVESNGGTVALASSPGRGSTFYVSFTGSPARAAAPAATPLPGFGNA